jgi:hypothetical protein
MRADAGGQRAQTCFGKGRGQAVAAGGLNIHKAQHKKVEHTKMLDKCAAAFL